MAATTNRRTAAEQKQKDAAKGSKGKEVLKQQTTALATTNKATAVAVKQQVANLIEEDAGTGTDSFDRQDLAIPRISIIQSNSPQLKKAEGKFIKGAEEGDFLDSVTNEVFAKGGDGFLFIPVTYRRTDIEWIPRKKGGGFVADHGSDGQILSQCTKDDETGAMLLKNGNEVVTTAEYIGFALDKDGGNPRQVAISLAKTQLKKARRVNTILSTLSVPKASGAGFFNPAFFYSAFTVTSIPEQSKKGEAFMGWQYQRTHNTLDLPNGEHLYIAARQFREAVSSGAVKVAAPGESDIEHQESDDSTL